MNEFKMDMALEEIPVSGWTCFKTCTWCVRSQRLQAGQAKLKYTKRPVRVGCDCGSYLVDVNFVALHSFLGALLPASAGLLGHRLLCRLGEFLLCLGSHVDLT